MADEVVILRLEGITKAYPGVVALDKVSLALRRGEVHALVGENGAGKSTLIKCISGAIRPDSGHIYMDGKEFSSIGPRDTISHGIVTVYQELNLISTLTVAENVFVGVRQGGDCLYDRGKNERACQGLLDEFKIGIRADTVVRKLSAAQRQLVEIVRAISRNVRVLILDEPTSSLTVHETRFLFETIGRLKEQGVTIIYISHIFEETFALSDRITVLRDGCAIATVDTAVTSRQELISLMVGRDMQENFPQRQSQLGGVVMEVQHIFAPDVEDISFTLRRGEVLGFAGLVGAGRTELMNAVYGAVERMGGTIAINGREARIHSPREGIQNGLGMIPEDRKLQGVFLRASILANISSANLKRLSRLGFMDDTKARAIAESFQVRLDIRTPSLSQLAQNLSGGNQQKVALAKALAPEPRILIFDEPTRGIDVAAKQEIYKLMNELVEQGCSILMVSSDMVELMGMADRIIVLAEHRKAGELERAQFSQELILSFASGDEQKSEEVRR